MGGNGYRRGFVAGTAEVGGGALTGALDATFNAGPWELDENLQQVKLHLSHVFDLGGAAVRLSLQGYDAAWDATDQIPKRAVLAGLIDERGFIDPDLGGDARRLAVTGQADFDFWQVGGYFLDYDFRLFSNFTYLLEDPLLGDEFEQRDRRHVWGAWAQGEAASWLADRQVVYRWGGDLRFDDIDEVGLHPTSARQRLGTTRHDRVRELSLSAFGEAEVRWTERLRTVVGLRGDRYDWEVSPIRAKDSRTGNDGLVSPKFSLAYRIHDRLEAYASWGRGFHSNDVRVTGERGQELNVLARSEGAELGLRFEASEDFNATLTGFWLELDSELVYVGDAGTTEASDPLGAQGFGIGGVLARWRLADAPCGVHWQRCQAEGHRRWRRPHCRCR